VNFAKDFSEFLYVVMLRNLKATNYNFKPIKNIEEIEEEVECITTGFFFVI